MLEAGVDSESGETWWDSGAGYSGLYTTTLFAERASKIIGELDDESDPVFMWLAFHGAHDDDQSNPEDGYSFRTDFSKYTEAAVVYRDVRTRLGHVLLNLDEGVAEVTAAINASGLWGSTVLIVQSDNGGDPCGQFIAGDNYPYRGSKMTYFEGGVKVPGFIYAPGILGGGSEYVGLMHHADWLSTIVEGIAGGTVDDNSSDSINHWAAIVEQDAKGSEGSDIYELRDTIIFTLDSGYAALRYKDMKLMYQLYNSSWFNVGYNAASHEDVAWDTDDNDHENEQLFCEQADEDGVYNFMFNITADPSEKVNLYDVEGYSEVQQELLAMYAETYAEQFYTPTYPFGTTETNETLTMFYQHGGYAVPWGCEVQ